MDLNIDHYVKRVLMEAEDQNLGMHRWMQGFELLSADRILDYYKSMEFINPIRQNANPFTPIDMHVVQGQKEQSLCWVNTFHLPIDTDYHIAFVMQGSLATGAIEFLKSLCRHCHYLDDQKRMHLQLRQNTCNRAEVSNRISIEQLMSKESMHDAHRILSQGYLLFKEFVLESAYSRQQ